MLDYLFYITLKYQFFKIFLIISLSSYTITTVHSRLSTSGYVKKENLRICKERKKKKIICKVNSVNINLHNYCNNFTNLHIVNLTNVGDFIYIYIYIECVKVISFLYFALFGAEMLLEPCYSFNFPLQC